MSEQDRSTPAKAGLLPRRHLPLVLIGIGLLILVSNAGPFGSVLWSVLWPVGLIAVGVDLITEGRQRRRIGLGALLGVVALTPLIGGARFVDRGRAEFQNFGRPAAAERVELADVDRVRAQIRQTAGDLQIEALPDDSSEVARVDREGQINSYTTEDRIGVLDVTTNQRWGMGDLDLRLTRRVPLDLTVDLAAGSAEDLDLRHLQLEKLDLTVRAGDAGVRLPDQGVMDINVSGGVGSVEIDVPNDLPTQIIVDPGISEMEYDRDRFQEQNGALVSEGYSAEAPNRATIRISNSVGEIEIK